MPTNVAESTEAVPTEEGLIGPVQPTGNSEHDENIESSTESSAIRSFIGPVIPGDAVKSTDSDVELVSARVELYRTSCSGVHRSSDTKQCY